MAWTGAATDSTEAAIIPSKLFIAPALANIINDQ
jgi:hypothetical protein